MVDNQGAAKPALKTDVEREIGYIGARLREKSTYAGLTVMVALLLPIMSRYIPGLSNASAASIVNDISAIGIGIGGLIAIFLPENGIAKVVALLIVASAALVFAHPANAATRKADPAKLQLPCIGTSNLPLGCKPGAQAAQADAAALASALAKPFQDIANLITADNANAIKLSTAIASLQDGNGQACWTALQSFSQVVKAHPVPATFQVASDIEALRLLSMATNNVCKNSACTQVFTELADGVQQLAPANFSIAIPSLSSLCSKVPQIAVVTPGIAAPSTSATSTPASK